MSGPPAGAPRALPPGGVGFTGTAGVGTATTTPMPDARRTAPTLNAPYDPAGELNRLKSDGDTATFSIQAGAKVAVPTPWTGTVAVGPQVQAGYGVTVKQVGGGGPGESSSGPPRYAVTFDKNQMAGVYGQKAVGASDSLFGKAKAELNLTHADRVTMTFDNKDDAARSIRLLQGEAEAQALRDTKTVIAPTITVPDPVAAAKDLAGRAMQDPVGTALHELNPVTRAKAAVETGKTIVDGAVRDFNSVFSNPLKGDNHNEAPPPGTIEIPVGNPVSTVLGYGADALAEKLQPSAADQAFLASHVTGYEEAVGAQERAAVELKFGDVLGLDVRGTASQTLTRTVTLPKAPDANGQGGAPGTVSYEAKFGVDVSAKEKAKLEGLLGRVSVKVPDVKGNPVTDALEVNSVTTLGQASVAAKLTYAMTPEQSAALQASNGTAIPGVTQMGDPTKLDVTYQGRLMIPNPAAVFGPGVPAGDNLYGSYKVQGSIANPAATLGEAKDTLMASGVPGAIETLARNGTATGELALTRQEGGNIGMEPGLSVKKGPLGGAEAKLTLSGQAQTDTVVARARGQIAWEDKPPVQPLVQGPPLPTPPTPYQVAVVPHDGLNIRAQPGTDAPVLGPAYSGTFLQATGQTRTDAQGREWLEVSGPDMHRTEHKGWVASEYVQRHPEGAMADGSGRINELRQQGYVAIPVQPGDTISGIALKNGADPSKAVTVNNGHVIDVDLIFPGDTVYIPGRRQ